MNRDYKKFPDRQAKIDERHNKNEFILIKYNNSTNYHICKQGEQFNSLSHWSTVQAESANIPVV